MKLHFKTHGRNPHRPCTQAAIHVQPPALCAVASAKPIFVWYICIYMHFMQCLHGCTLHKMKIALVTMPFALKFSHCPMCIILRCVQAYAANRRLIYSRCSSMETTLFNLLSIRIRNALVKLRGTSILRRYAVCHICRHCPCSINTKFTNSRIHNAHIVTQI